MATISRSNKKTSKNRDSNTNGPGGAWHDSAPNRVQKAYQARDEQQGWSAWRQHLAKRKVKPLVELLPGKRSPLLWALPAGVELSATIELIADLHQLSRSQRPKSTAIENEAACWLSNSESARGSSLLGLECLGWTAALQMLAEMLPERLWWLLLNRLVSIAGEELPSSDDPLAVQLLRGELPLSLAYLFSELQKCRALADGGHQAIANTIAEVLDGEGLPHCKHLAHLRTLLASWTRCRLIGAELTDKANEGSEHQYAGVVQHALQLSRADGTTAFSTLDSATWHPTLLKTAVRLADDRNVERIARLTQDGRRAGKKAPSPGFEGEWAGLAVLRTDWDSSAPQLHVNYGSGEVITELNVGKRCLWSGAWQFDVQFNRKPLAKHDEWQQVCWISDENVDYLELQMELDEEVTVQRHIVLARRERFLLLSDAVLGIQAGLIEYRGTLPLVGYSSFQPERETREGFLEVDGKPRARVLPLALPEWRASPARGSLDDNGGLLQLRQSIEGQCLFTPLFLDLNPKALGKEASWRQLTVAQLRQIVPSDVAVGYRVQVGKAQHVVYRSLQTPDIRTVLGKNLMHEFLVGNFQSDGETETLLEIE